MIEYPVVIPLNAYVGRLVTMDVMIVDETLTFLFDTGGGKTFIVPETARRLGFTPSGRGVSFRMNGEIVESQYCQDISLFIAGIPFHYERMGVWDINSVLPDGLPHLDGILSLDTFKNQPFTLDLASKQLMIESQRTMENCKNDMTRLESRIATGLDGSELDVFLYGSIKEYGWFLFDSGNLDAIIVSPHLALETRSDAVDSSDPWQSTFAFQNLAPVSAEFRTKKIIYDGALSEAFLREWVFTFDLNQNSIWAMPTKGN